jgi:predicted nucleic acid-binding protein
MPYIVAFDAGPLGLITKAPGKPGRDAIRRWFDRHRSAGVLFAVPGIARYENRRELILHGATRGLARLREFEEEAILLPVTEGALERAAELWALARKGGFPGASDDSLDADCILAAQAERARGARDTIVIATDNLRHFARFPGIDARRWQEIEP